MKKLMVLLPVLLLAMAAYAKPAEHEMLVKVQAGRAAIPALQEAGLYLYAVENGYIRGAITPSNATKLDARGYQYEVLIPDMVKYAEDAIRPQAGGFGVYHTYQQIMDTFNIIATNNPSICKLETVGRSPAGNYLVALGITQNPRQENHRPRVLWDGTTHGNENIGTEACWYFVQQLVGRYGADPLITQLVNTREIWIIPCVNPDGLISRSRGNSNGIDLNRENGYAWDNASGAPTSFSQPEIQGMRRFFQRHHFVLNVTYHSGATVAMWVWGWTDHTPRDLSIMSDQVTRYANTCGYSYGMISQVMYFAPGGSTDWNYGCEGSMGYAAEISGGQPPPSSEIDTIAHANWTASRDLMVRGGWGVRGQITDSISGGPVKRAVVVTTPSGWMTFTDTCGWYFRGAYAGSYSVKVMADGYATKTVSGVTVPTDSWVIANVALRPDSTAPITGYKVTTWHCPDYSQAGASEGLSVLGRHDGTSLCITNHGLITIEMGQPILNGAGTDFTVYSTSSKPCSVLVTADSFNGPWHLCAYGTGNISCDLTNAGVALAKFVRLGDAGQGYDLDAIEGVVVNAPALSYQSLRIVDSTGNNNGRLDPGETAPLIVSLHNAGRQPANNVTGHLHGWSAWVAMNDSLGSFGTIAPDSVRDNNADRFDVTADVNAPRGTSADFTLYLTGAGYSDSVRFTTVIGQITPVDPIPDGPRTPSLYWAYDDIDSGFVEHPTYNWVEINGVGTRLTYSQNDVVLLITIPSAFGPLKYYGQRYTQMSISADGWISPGNNTTSNFANTSLPSSAAPVGAICANWDDLDPYPDGAGYIYDYHDVANHRFIVEWDSVEYWSQTSIRDKFEIVFFDTTSAPASGDNVIVFQYKTANLYTSSTVGIQDQTQAIAIQDLYNGAYHQAAAPIAAFRAIKYCTVQPASVVEEGSGSNARHLTLQVWPTVSRGVLSVRAPLTANCTPLKLGIFDISGRSVRQLELVAGVTTQVDTRNLPNGVYFVSLAQFGRSRVKVVLNR